MPSLVDFVLCLIVTRVVFSLVPAVSAETLGSESLKVAWLTSSLKVMLDCMSMAFFSFMIADFLT